MIKIALIVVAIVVVILLSILIPCVLIRKKYTNFVNLHSKALKELSAINKRYKFYKIADYDMYHKYDNENFYDDISPRDYLTYQLTYQQKEIREAMSKTLKNKSIFDLYHKEVVEKCFINDFDVESLKNKKLLEKIERKLLKQSIKQPVIKFMINVELELTNINGDYKDSKNKIFYPNEISEIIHQINQKRGSFYLNEEVWKSLCRVERGKVSNKMRFSIYERDGYRCCKCGRRTDDLEIDHIIPISRGGKSTYDNLQTLCHRCNYRKGSNIE